MDEVDEKILELLKKDSRRSYLSLSKQLNISETAVRRRVKKLLEKGYIKRFTIEVDLGFQAFILIAVSAGFSCPEVARKILEIKGVEEVHEISGQYDILSKISARSHEEANKIIENIRSIDGVKSTYTSIILKSHY